MAARRFTDEQEQEIARRYQAGENQVVLADAFRVSCPTVRGILKRNGVKIRGISEAKRSFTEDQELEIARRYADGETTIRLGQEFGVSNGTISQVLKRRGIERRIVGDYSRIFDDQQEADVCSRYQNGESASGLGKEFGVKHGVITDCLRRHGIPVRSQKEVQGKLSSKQEAEICSRYQAGESSIRLSKDYSVGREAIGKVLRRHGVSMRALNRFGSEQEQEIARRYLAGEGTMELANEFQLSRKTIGRILERHGFSLRPKTELIDKLISEHAAQICSYYKEGKSTTELGDEYGVSANSIMKVLAAFDVPIRPAGESLRSFTEDQEKKIGAQYAAGANATQIGKDYGVTPGTIYRVLKRQGVPIRAMGESQRSLDSVQEAEVCSRYAAGENTYSISDDYDISIVTVYKALHRGGVEIREGITGGDSVEYALTSTGHYSSQRECSFYVFDLANHPGCSKPGIAFNLETRITQSGGEYGDMHIEFTFATRQEAFFLEQAVLDATRGCARCPSALAGWAGASEVRAMPAEDLVAIAERLADEMDELGVWEFAARYVPMTSAQRAICQQRALENEPAFVSVEQD